MPVAKICPTCQRPLPEDVIRRVPDEQIIAALATPRTEFVKRKPTKMWPWLYASSDGGRGADFRRWYVTGPRDRVGYIRGPFPPEQVRRIAASGKIKPVVVEDGLALAYKIAEAD